MKSLKVLGVVLIGLAIVGSGFGQTAIEIPSRAVRTAMASPPPMPYSDPLPEVVTPKLNMLGKMTAGGIELTVVGSLQNVVYIQIRRHPEGLPIQMVNLNPLLVSSFRTAMDKVEEGFKWLDTNAPVNVPVSYMVRFVGSTNSSPWSNSLSL